jgi:hypothetical protein
MGLLDYLLDALSFTGYANWGPIFFGIIKLKVGRNTLRVIRNLMSRKEKTERKRETAEDSRI